MIILDYNKKNHKNIIHACVEVLRRGKVVAYPTDTCYGLAVDAENIKAVKLLYKVKGRSFKKPISIIPPSLVYVKRIVKWNKTAEKLAKKFFPGAITLVLPLKYHPFNSPPILGGEERSGGVVMLSAGTGELGIRQPNNNIALDLARVLKRPITTTSANLAGKPECYSLSDIQKQFSKKKFRPDVIINAGRLKHQHPSTLIKVNQDQSIQILRSGPVSEKNIKKALRGKG